MDDTEARIGDENLSDEELRKLWKPSISEEKVEEVLKKSYALDGEKVEILEQLDSYDDVNYKVRVDGTPYLLKVHNGVESKDFLKVYDAAGQDYYKKGSWNSVIHLQSSIMALLNANGISTSHPREARDTNAPVSVHLLPVVSEHRSPQRLAVRLLSWVEGQIMSSPSILPIESLADAGRFLGKIDKVLDHLSLESIQSAPRPSGLESLAGSADVIIDRSVLEPAGRYHQWDGKNTADLRSFSECIKDEQRRNLVVSILDAFQRDIIDSGDSAKFRVGVNQGDYNDANILLNDDFTVSGVIDFGDSVQR